MKINIGGGNFHQKGWLNLDYPFEAQAHKRKFNLIDIKHNLMSGEPFPVTSDSVSIYYSEHCIEHLTMDAGVFMLKEVYRTLNPGGALRIAFPDSDKLYDNYMGSDAPFGFNSKLDGCSRETEILDFLATPLMGTAEKEVERMMKEYPMEKVFDDLCLMAERTLEEQAQKPGDHLSWWNYDKMRWILNDIGFRKIRRAARQDSKCPELRFPYIDKTAPYFTCYVECGK